MGQITRVGTGHSKLASARDALNEALTRASILPTAPKLGLIFAGPDHDLAALLRAAHNRLPDTKLLGSTTAGEFTESGFSHNGVAVCLVYGDGLLVESAFSRELTRGAESCARNAAEGFGAAEMEARHRGLATSMSIILLDGLTGAGERFVAEMLKRTRPFQPMVGGAAGDEGRFRRTLVGSERSAASDAAAVAHVFAQTPWGIGVGSGLRATTDRMLVTRADGNTLHEIDGRPAFDVYRDHALGRGVHLTPENAVPYLIANELGVYFLDEVSHARAPLAVAHGGALTLAASIERGASVCILDGDPSAMILAARRAARDARESLKGRRVAGALVFDCVCRGMIMKSDFPREIDAVREELGDVPVAGFLTYGEIARYSSKLSGWHNASAVVVAIPE